MAITKFYVEVNPFTETATIRAKIGKDTYEEVISYELSDDWQTFMMGGCAFDVNFYYDGELSVKICSSEQNWVLQGAFPTKITINLKD